MRYISIALCALLHLVCGIAAAQQGLLLYVPNQTSNNVSVFQTNTDGTLTAVTTIAGTGSGPSTATVRGDQAVAYVVSPNSGQLHVINTATNTFTTISGFSTPEVFAITPNAKTGYLSNRLADQVVIFTADPITGQLTNTGTPITFAANTRPRGLAITPDGSRLVVANQGNPGVPVPGSVAVYDITNPTSPVLVGVNPTAMGQLVAVAVSPGTTLAFAVDASGDNVYPVDTANPTGVIAPIVTGDAPRSVAVSALGSHLYVTSRNDQEVEVYNSSGGASLQQLGVTGAFGVVLSRNGDYLYATGQNGLNAVALFSVAPGTGLLTAVPGGFATGADPAHPGLCANGNRLLAAGNTFVANSGGALACTLPSVPTFTGGTLRVNAAGLVISSALSLNGFATIDTNGNNATIAGVVSGTGTFVKAGTGILLLGATNTYSGPGTMINAGTLLTGSSNTLPASTAVTVAAGATLDLFGFSQTVGSLAGAGAVTLGTGTLTAGGSNASTTFSGAISGSGGLTKTGTGTLTLSGTNSYTGATTVSNGALRVNGTLASPVTVAAGMALSGTGTISGAVSVGAVATIDPGAGAPGILSTGSLNLLTDSVLSIRIFGTALGTQYSQVKVTGTVNLTNTNLNPTLGFATTPGQVFTIIDNDGADAVTGTFAFLPEGSVVILGGGTSMRLSYVGGDGNDVTLTVVTVPGAPAITSATPGNGQATIAFSTPANGGAPIGNYAVTCNPGTIVVNGPASPIIVGGLANGTTYSCTVVAVNGAGQSAPSAPASVTPFTIPGAPSITAVTPGNAQITVTFTPATPSGSPITGYVASCGGITASGAGSPITVTGLTNGTAYTCTVLATSAAGNGPSSAPSTSATPVSRSYSGPSATGSGTITASFTGGGAGCTFTVSQFIPLTGHPASPTASAPGGVTFPHGLFDFTVAGCTPGSPITMTVTYPAALPAGTQYWKFGPTPTSPSPVWYSLPATIAGSVATFTITDGQLGDDDRTANGTIVDQGGPGIPGPAGAPHQTPTLSEWMLMLLASLMLGSAWYGGRRRLKSPRTTDRKTR